MGKGVEAFAHFVDLKIGTKHQTRLSCWDSSQSIRISLMTLLNDCISTSEAIEWSVKLKTCKTYFRLIRLRQVRSYCFFTRLEIAEIHLLFPMPRKFPSSRSTDWRNTLTWPGSNLILLCGNLQRPIALFLKRIRFLLLQL